MKQLRCHLYQKEEGVGNRYQWILVFFYSYCFGMAGFFFWYSLLMRVRQKGGLF